MRGKKIKMINRNIILCVGSGGLVILQLIRIPPVYRLLAAAA